MAAALTAFVLSSAFVESDCCALTKCFKKNGDVFWTSLEQCPEGYFLNDPTVYTPEQEEEDTKREWGPTVFALRLGTARRKIFRSKPTDPYTAYIYSEIGGHSVGFFDKPTDTVWVENIDVSYLNDSVSKINVEFNAVFFHMVVAALKNKCGNPTETSSHVVQNRFGAQYDNEVFVWIFPSGDALQVEKYSSTLDKGLLVYGSNAYFENTVSKKSVKVKGF